MKAITLPL